VNITHIPFYKFRHRGWVVSLRKRLIKGRHSVTIFIFEEHSQKKSIFVMKIRNSDFDTVRHEQA